MFVFLFLLFIYLFIFFFFFCGGKTFSCCFCSSSKVNTVFCFSLFLFNFAIFSPALGVTGKGWRGFCPFYTNERWLTYVFFYIFVVHLLHVSLLLFSFLVNVYGLVHLLAIYHRIWNWISHLDESGVFLQIYGCVKSSPLHPEYKVLYCNLILEGSCLHGYKILNLCLY